MGVFRYLLWKTGIIVVDHILFWGVRIDVTGLDNLPNEKAVLAANHNHMWDPLALILVVYKKTRRKIHTFAQYKSLISPFRSRLLRRIEKSLFKKNLMLIFAEDMMEQIPVCTGMKKLNKRAHKKAGYYLGRDDFVAIFPQGDIKERKKGQLYSGVARVAVDNEVPIVPIHLWNDGKKDTISIKKDFKRYKMIIGKPITSFLHKKIKAKSQFKFLSKNVLENIYKLG